MHSAVKNLYKFIVVLICILAVIMPGILSISLSTAKAEGERELEFDKTEIVDDLQGVTIDGAPFDLSKYDHLDLNQKAQVIAFVEYGFGANAELMGNFGLYVYVYNPQGLTINKNSPLNKISLTKNYPASNYKKYQLKYINSGSGNSDALLFKFKIVLSDEEWDKMTSSPTATMRTYSIGEIELMTVGATGVVSYPVSATYRYMGYAKGYNPNEEESTLRCISDANETLSLDVHPTVYRPEGNNGKNEYTQDSLHSVYFAVPNSMLDRYGNLTKIHAEWLNAVLKPALVTGNQDAYSAIEKRLGEDVSTLTEAHLPYHYLSNAEFYDKGSSSIGANVHCDYYYGIPTTYERYEELYDHLLLYEEKLSCLYLLFNSGEEVNSADNYYVKGKQILEQMEILSANYGGELVNGKYSKCIFESVDENFTEVNISADENFSLTSDVVLDQNWWESIWGIKHVNSTIFDGIKAIQPVSKEDMLGAGHDIAESLYISYGDIEEFISFYNESTAQNKTVFLFRYQVSDYVAQEATLVKKKYQSFVGVPIVDKVDTNAYFFKQTVNLAFDIIDVTFSTGLKETVIACVSSPIDVAGPATPPIETETDPLPPFVWGVVISAGLIIVACGVGIFIEKRFRGEN